MNLLNSGPKVGVEINVCVAYIALISALVCFKVCSIYIQAVLHVPECDLPTVCLHFLSVIYCIYVFLCGSLFVQNKVILNLELAQQTETMVKTRLCNTLPSPFSISIKLGLQMVI